MQTISLGERFVRAKRALFDKIYNMYNLPQRAAICAVNGHLLVLAGAGSGKTTVLVRRVAQIIRYGNAYEDESLPGYVTEEDVKRLEEALSLSADEIGQILTSYAVEPCPPYGVLAITFTNKAAGQIKERLAAILGPETAAEVWAGTFHSICVRILRRDGAAIGVDRNFTIYDQEDGKKVIAAAVEQLKLDDKVFSPRKVMSAISSAKDKLLDPDDLAARAGSDYFTEKCAEIYRVYEARLREAEALDFDDLIRLTVKLLRENEKVRDYYARKFRYVCIDEYQDTNVAQFELAKLFSGVHNNLMVVGDDDQSIYRFRGATIENILRFDKDFKDARVIKLEQNYRSTSTILNAANAVIANNNGRHEKRLWCEREKGAPLTVKRLDNQNEEARYVVNKISAQTGKSGDRKFSDFAVLYRINAQSNALENAFMRSGIPYRVLGSTRFYDRKEVRDVLAYLSVVFNPGDNLRLKRIINEPKRKIGNATITAVEQLAAVEGKTMFEVMKNARDYPALAKAAAKLGAFCALIEELRGIAESESLPSLVEHTIEDSGYTAMLEEEGLTEIDRLENVKELVSNAVEYAARTPDADLQGFLEETSLVSDTDNYDEHADSVVLMTVHSAKGLEFPVVFLPGMEEGIFPAQQSSYDEGELEEERRLAYVALTRAKDKVFISHVRERMLYGHTQYNPLSRFVREIPEGLLIDETEQGGSRAQRIVNRKAQLMDNARSNILGTRSAPKEAPEKVVSPAGQYERFGKDDVVEHSVFGRGKIVAVTSMGGDMLYEIEFETVGKKKLMATYARLRRG